MKTAAGRLVLAVVLFVAGAAFWAEARLARRVAGAHERLATLHYDSDDDIDEAMTTLNRLPWSVGSLQREVRRHRATVAYWKSQHDVLTNGASAAPEPAPAARPDPDREDEEIDAELMFVAANTAFRASQRQPGARAAAIERLDAIMQAYAEVLRASPEHADAAFNYEFVARFRDTMARGRPSARGRKPADEEVAASVDLPAGPTIHGRPGAPPAELPGDQFKTIAPMPFEEREETDPGQGPRPRRRG